MYIAMQFAMYCTESEFLIREKLVNSVILAFCSRSRSRLNGTKNNVYTERFCCFRTHLHHMYIRLCTYEGRYLRIGKYRARYLFYYLFDFFSSQIKNYPLGNRFCSSVKKSNSVKIYLYII